MGKKAERGPKYIASPLNNDMINYAEYYLSATEKALFFLLTFVAGGAAGMVFYGGLFGQLCVGNDADAGSTAGLPLLSDGNL